MTGHPRNPPAPTGPVPGERIADQVPALPGPASQPETRSAMRAYLGVPIAGFIPPLWVYLVSGRRSAFARRHAAEALRVSFAAVIYGICALIVAGMLALDSVKIAVIVVGPLVLALWLVIVIFAIRAARAAGRGRMQQFPSWLRVSPRSQPGGCG